MDPFKFDDYDPLLNTLERVELDIGLELDKETPKEGIEARVLLVEANSNDVELILRSMLHGRFGANYEIVKIGSVNSVIEMIDKNPLPYYSLVIYNANNIQSEGSAGIVARVRKKDFFLPQMVYGRPLGEHLIGHLARAGVQYFAADRDSAHLQIVHNIFKKPTKLSNATVIKIGGSAFDFDRQVKDCQNLQDVCDALVEIHLKREQLVPHTKDTGNTVLKKRKIVNRIIVTVGAGQYGDIVKDHTGKYYHMPYVVEQHQFAISRALQQNLENLRPHFFQQGSIVSTGAFYYITKATTADRIPLIGTAPHYILARDRIPLSDSDTHTVAIAEFYGAERIILVKRTDGIYDYDPYRGFRLDSTTYRCSSYGDWHFAQRENKRRGEVSLDEFLSNTIVREGTGVDGKPDGSQGHLMEDSALEYMKKCRFVKEIVVVHLAPEEMYHTRSNGSYEHIITGETRPKETDWSEILRQNILDAFEGKAKSKIVKR